MPGIGGIFSDIFRDPALASKEFVDLLGDKQNWYEEKNAGCQGTNRMFPPSLRVAGEEVREDLQEEGVFQLKAGEKVYPEQRGRCVSGGGHSVCKDQLATCVRRIKGILGGPFWKRAISTAEESCGRSFRSTSSHWPPAVLRRNSGYTRLGPISGGHGGVVRGRAASFLGRPGPKLKGDQPEWLTVL